MDSAVHQLASASLAVAFSVGMVFGAHLFTEYRSNRTPPVAMVQPVAGPSQAGPRPSAERADSLAPSANWRSRAI